MPAIFGLARPAVRGSKYRNLILGTAGLFAYWPFTVAHPWDDIVGGFTLTPSGSPSLGPSIIPTNKLDGSLVLPGSAFLSGTVFYWPSRMSTECWVTANGAGGAILGAWNSGGAMLYLNPTVLFYVGSTALGSGATPPSVLPSMYVVGTCDGTNRSIYINGVLAAGPTAGVAASSNGAAFNIGTYQSLAGSAMVGSISGVALYDRPLTAAQIAERYRVGRLG